MANQRRKCREFRAGGVEVVWLIDPISRSIEVFEGERDGETVAVDGALTSEHLPGFAVGVPELFGVLDKPTA